MKQKQCRWKLLRQKLHVNMPAYILAHWLCVMRTVTVIRLYANSSLHLTHARYDLGPPRNLGNQEAMQQKYCGWLTESSLLKQKWIKTRISRMASSTSKPCQKVFSTRTKLFAIPVNANWVTTRVSGISNTTCWLQLAGCLTLNSLTFTKVKLDIVLVLLRTFKSVCPSVVACWAWVFNGMLSAYFLSMQYLWGYSVPHSRVYTK